MAVEEETVPREDQIRMDRSIANREDIPRERTFTRNIGTNLMCSGKSVVVVENFFKVA